MKKRILSLGVVLALLSVLVMPMAVSADAATFTSDVLGSYAAGVSPTHTISFTPTTALVDTNTITITFPAGFTGVGEVVDEDVAETTSGAGVVWTGSGQDLTGVVPAAGLTTDPVVITINASEITNPSVGGNYVISMVTTTDAEAATTTVKINDVDATEISGTQPEIFTFTAPVVDIETAGALVLETNTGDTTDTGEGVVISNVAWTIAVEDTKTTTDGYMTIGGLDVSETNLEATLVVGTVSASGTIDAYQTLLQSLDGGLGTTAIPLYVSQTVANSDPPGEYSITLTFTCSPS